MSWLDDAGARKLIKEISILIKSKNPSDIKKELQKWLDDPDSGVSIKEYNRAIAELDRNGVSE